MHHGTALDCKIVVAGGGMAGALCTVSLATCGFEVICCDPGPLPGERSSQIRDNRTTAFLGEADGFLRKIGVWTGISHVAQPLQVMRIVDSGVGSRGGKPIVREFDASSSSRSTFGWTVPNAALWQAVDRRQRELPNARFKAGSSVSSATSRLGDIVIFMESGLRLRARLLVVADGRNSVLRSRAGIRTLSVNLGQKALSFDATHSIPHANVTTEVHRLGGPFTMVPLGDFEGMSSSAIVWMDSASKIEELAGLRRSEFKAAANERSLGILGDLDPLQLPSVWSLRTQLARRLHAERTAIVGEAAHVVPPIGAQGLNMTLADISALCKILEEFRGDPGDSRALTAYSRNRHPAIAKRVMTVSMLNEFSRARMPVMHRLRGTALRTINDLPAARELAVQWGLGERMVGSAGYRD